MLLNNAIPIRKADGMREFIEETGLRLTDSSHLRALLPTIRQKDINDILQPLKAKKILVSDIFDGTTRICEAFAVL